MGYEVAKNGILNKHSIQTTILKDYEVFEII